MSCRSVGQHAYASVSMAPGLPAKDTGRSPDRLGSRLQGLDHHRARRFLLEARNAINAILMGGPAYGESTDLR
jgi:hypothetical protein